MFNGVPSNADMAILVEDRFRRAATAPKQSEIPENRGEIAAGFCRIESTCCQSIAMRSWDTPATSLGSGHVAVEEHTESSFTGGPQKVQNA
jgi:hypothetical protein